MKATLSLTWRLTLLFVIAASTVLIGLGMVIAAAVEQHFQEQDMEVLVGKMTLTRHTLELLTTVDDLPHVTLMLDNALIGHHGLELLVLTPQRELLYATQGANFTPQLVIDSARQQPNRPSTWTLGTQTYRGIAAAAFTSMQDMPPATALLALNIGHHLEFMSAFRKSLWLAIVSGILLTVLLGWIAARRGLLPLRDMVQVAHGISASRLDRRLQLDEVPTELLDLATAFNQMLDRLQGSFKRLSDFSSDLAHELRTPISNLMTESQVVLSRARSADEYREVLYSNLEEYDRLARMISDMLFLAKADHGLIALRNEPVDLAKEVRQLFEFYEALSDEQGVRLALEGEGMANGDDLMLRRALSNLLSNALRHTPREGAITVSISRASTGEMLIAVENTGQTISPEHLPRLFDRFYQVDPSRHRTHEGAGLGLAITKSIIDAHGGKISVTSENGLTRFVMAIPAVTPP